MFMVRRWVCILFLGASVTACDAQIADFVNNRSRSPVKGAEPATGLSLSISNPSASIAYLASGTFTITVSNQGTGTISSVVFNNTSNCIQDSNTCSGTLAAGASCLITGHIVATQDGALSCSPIIQYSESGSSRDKTASISAVGTYPGAVSVQKDYPVNGANWNDYVKNEEANKPEHLQSDEACNYTGITYPTFHHCVHAAEKLKVRTGQSACTNLTITETLAAFDWFCEVTDGEAYFYTRNLKDGKGLRDLLDPTAWKDNKVDIRLSGTLILQSTLSAWWSNPVAALPDSSGGQLTLTASPTVGNIYTVAATMTGQMGYLLNSKHAVVTLNNSKIVAAAAGIPTTCPRNTGNEPTSCLFGGTGISETWMEVDLEGGSGVQGLISIETSSPTWVNVRNRIHGSRIHGGTAVGINITGSDFGRITHSSVAKSSYGFLCDFPYHCQGTLFYKIVSTENSKDGFENQLTPESVYNTIVANNNNRSGMKVRNVRIEMGMYLTGITTLSNTHVGTYLEQGTKTTMLSIASSNNVQNGLYLRQGDKIVISNIATTNNGISGVNIVNIDATEPTSKFTGALIVGNNTTSNCYVQGVVSTNVALIDGTCTASGADGSSSYAGRISTATLRTGRSTQTSFVGGLTANDVLNTADTLGIAAVGAITFFDWFRFDNFFRSWSPPFSAAFSDYRGHCTAGNCQIFDSSLRLSDTVLFNRSGDGLNANSTVSAGICPAEVNGNATETDANGNTYLLSAFELILDGNGNDNGLCESNERCIYAPNFGAYQGHGDYSNNTCTFQNGTVTSVTMFMYPNNGY